MDTLRVATDALRRRFLDTALQVRRQPLQRLVALRPRSMVVRFARAAPMRAASGRIRPMLRCRGPAVRAPRAAPHPAAGAAPAADP